MSDRVRKDFDRLSVVAAVGRIVREHGLLPTPFAEAANWAFANYAFAPTWDVMLDNTKARKYGFQEFVDSEEMFLRIFDDFRRQRFIP